MLVAAFGESLQGPERVLLALVPSLCGGWSGGGAGVRESRNGLFSRGLGVDLLCFGLSHGQFWALCVMLLGFVVLGGMVSTTVYLVRRQTLLQRLRGTFVEGS